MDLFSYQKHVLARKQHHQTCSCLVHHQKVLTLFSKINWTATGADLSSEDQSWFYIYIFLRKKKYKKMNNCFVPLKSYPSTSTFTNL